MHIQVNRAKVRYRTLDGLRGVAAIIVIMLHMPLVFGIDGLSPGQGALAVDMFFCLSGFVLAKSYDPRFATGMTAREFMALRFRRLMPLYWVGFALALFALAMAPAAGEGFMRTAPTLALNAVTLPGLSDTLFPFNPPAWSLFLEIWIANLSLALLWRWLGWRALFGIVAVCAIGFVVAVRIHHYVNLGVAYSTLLGGVARVGFSFFIGVAIARFHAARAPKLRVPGVALLAVLFICLWLPIPGRAGIVFQLTCIFAVFPAMIYWGAEAQERQPWVGSMLGNASYAAYVIHWPLFMLLKELLPPSVFAAPPAVLQIAIAAAVVLLALALDRFYDVPVRSAWHRRCG
jgi:peptidoglycan/LPS O-acetylase OafA/YrhL